LTAGTFDATTERWLTLRGLRTCVEDVGQGPPVLLAHGMWCDAGMFTEVARALSPLARVIAPDFRAHGRSETPDSAWQIADLALDLAELLDTLRIPRVTLAGFSMGGMAAVDFALRFPERVAGLVLVGTSAADEDMLRAVEIRASARLIELTGAPRFLAQEASRVAFSAGFRRSHPREVARWESAVRAMPRAALVQALRAVGSRPSHLGRLGTIRTPTAIVAGGADRVLKPRWSRAMHERIPGSRLEVYPGVGHAVPVERPRELATLIREFLPGGRT
jgi:3-oxoadipate enol-lactonase